MLELGLKTQPKHFSDISQNSAKEIREKKTSLHTLKRQVLKLGKRICAVQVSKPNENETQIPHL